MTPCVPDFQCSGPPTCYGDCPPGQSCFRIQDGYIDGYCTWTPPTPGTLLNISCESPDHNCCCTCEELEGYPECAFNTVAPLPPGQTDCDQLIQDILNSNNATSHSRPYGCCQMTDPETTSQFNKLCLLTGATVLPCNRFQTPRVPADPSRPYPLSDYYAPCYEPDPNFIDASDPVRRPIDPVYWNGIKFAEEGANPCADQNLCRGSCRVYSQCNDNPETNADPCKQGRYGIFCYAPNPPASECAEPVNGSCVALCECDWTNPTMIYDEFFCDGVGPIPYCTFSCPPEPCSGITCPEGYYCDNFAFPNCQPL